MDVGVGSLALCHNVSSPFQFYHFCVLLFGGLEPPTQCGRSVDQQLQHHMRVC